MKLCDAIAEAMANMEKATLQAFPLIAASRTGQLPEATQNGMRFIVGDKGVWRAIDLPWVRVVHQVAQSTLQLPYGRVEERIEFRCGPLPCGHIRQFVAEAREAGQIEIAAALIWNEHTTQWRYARREAISVSEFRIDYREVALEAGEHLVVDMHSHGSAAAFFSATDNEDDAGAMRVSLVLGNLDRQQPSSQMRLCMNGFFQALVVRDDGRMEVVP
jgi:PRTRC genetic system protein A